MPAQNNESRTVNPKNIQEVSSLLSSLPKEDRIAFIREKLGIEVVKDIIKNSYEIARILAFLKLLSNSPLAIDLFEPDWVNNLFETENSLKRAPCIAIKTILEELDEDSRIKFLIDKVGVSYLEKILKALGTTDCMLNLAHIMEPLPIKDTPIFLTKMLGLFEDDVGIHDFLCFSSEPRKWFYVNLFGTNWLIHILDNQQNRIENILKGLTENTRLRFLTEKLGIEYFKNYLNVRSTWLLPRQRLTWIMDVLPHNDRWLLLENLGIQVVKATIKNQEDRDFTIERLPEDKKDLFKQNTLEDKQIVIDKIKLFACQLEKEYQKKHQTLGIFCPHTKKSKAERLCKLATDLEKHTGIDWISLITQAKACEDKYIFQNILSHRTKNLLQNILEGHSGKGILSPANHTDVKWKGETPRFW